MFYRWRTNRKRDRFYRQTRGIFETPPMPVVPAPWGIVTMVSNNDVQMYLLSLKSFYARIRRGKVTAIIDRDMPAASREILLRHFPGIEFVILEDIDTGECQRGGTWERLVYLLDRTRDEYMIQMDCDTLTCGVINEVLDCAENNVAFTMPGPRYAIVPMLESAANARETEGNHIVIVAERLFDRYPHAEQLRYTRGSSGFAGFAKGGFARSQLETFHREMARLVGPRWTEWGTEQCASNFAIANSPNAIVLPWPKYQGGGPSTLGVRDQASFIHFYGTYRYLADSFAELGNRVIRELNGQEESARTVASVQ